MFMCIKSWITICNQFFQTIWLFVSINLTDTKTILDKEGFLVNTENHKYFAYSSVSGDMPMKTIMQQGISIKRSLMEGG